MLLRIRPLTLLVCLIALTAVSVSSESFLIASYPFSGNADDGSGGGFHGVATGDITPATDRHGSMYAAYAFDGIDDHVSVAHDDHLSPPDGIMLEAWIYPTALLEGAEPDDQILIKESQYQINLNPDTTISFGVGPHPWTHVYSLEKVRADEWLHVRGQYEFSTGALLLWVNNIYQGAAYRPMTDWSGLAPLYIGMNPSSSSGYYFTGIIDDVHVMRPSHDRYADNNCDGVYNIVDVVLAVGVAFRGVETSTLTPCTVSDDLLGTRSL